MKICRWRSVSIFILFLFATAASAGPPNGKGKPDKPNDGDGDSTECSYPSFADSPKDKLRGDEAKFYLKYGTQLAQFDRDTTTHRVFYEDGSALSIKDGNGDGRWFVEDMVDVQHRTGNIGISDSGIACGDCRPVGKRHSAWYNYSIINDLLDSDGEYLRLGGIKMAGAPYDLTRPPMGQKWYNNRLYTVWLSTFQRELDRYGTSKNGSQVFKPPMYVRSKVNFEQMKTPGFRFSMWLMPVETGSEQPGPIAYDGNPKNGFEMDLFEFEPVDFTSEDKVCGNTLEFSWINAEHTGRGKPPAGIDGKNHFEGQEEGYCTLKDCSDTFANPYPDPDTGEILRADINEGTHTIEFLWTTEEIVWAFNGEIVLEITSTNQIPEPDKAHYLIVSREMTNGLNSGDERFESGDVSFLPAEPGLYGWNGNSNIGKYFDNINSDKARIDSIEVFQIMN